MLFYPVHCQLDNFPKCSADHDRISWLNMFSSTPVFCGINSRFLGMTFEASSFQSALSPPPHACCYILVEHTVSSNTLVFSCISAFAHTLLSALVTLSFPNFSHFFSNSLSHFLHHAFKTICSFIMLVTLCLLFICFLRFFIHLLEKEKQR